MFVVMLTSQLTRLLFKCNRSCVVFSTLPQLTSLSYLKVSIRFWVPSALKYKLRSINFQVVWADWRVLKSRLKKWPLNLRRAESTFQRHKPKSKPSCKKRAKINSLLTSVRDSSNKSKRRSKKKPSSLTKLPPLPTANSKKRCLLSTPLTARSLPSTKNTSLKWKP